MPGVRLGDDAVLEAEHLARDREHALHGRVEREVLADPILVDAVLGAAQHVVVVAPVPGHDRSVVAVGGEQPLEPIQLAAHRLGERRQQLLVEGADPLRVARHLQLHGVVSPGRLAEHARDPLAQVEGLVEQRPVLVDRLVPVLREQLPPQLAVLGLVQERVELGVVEADPEGPGRLAGRQPLDVRSGRPASCSRVTSIPSLVLVDVALERDLDLDEPGAQSLELGPLLGRQLLAGAPEVAQPEVEEPAALAGQLPGLVGCGERADGLEQVAAEGDRHAPLVEPLLRLVAGVAHGGIGVDLAHEGAAAVCTDELGAGQLERQQGPSNEGGAETASATSASARAMAASVSSVTDATLAFV